MNDAEHIDANVGEPSGELAVADDSSDDLHISLLGLAFGVLTTFAFGVTMGLWLSDVEREAKEWLAA